MDLVQKLSDTDGYLTSIEVSALTTLDNELVVKDHSISGLVLMEIILTVLIGATVFCRVWVCTDHQTYHL